MKNARELAYDIICNVLFNDGYSNIEINKTFNNNDIQKIDKSFITELVYGTLEKKIFLDYIISKYINIPLKKLSKEVYVILLVSIYQIAFMDKVTDFAAVDESVKLCKKIQFRSYKFVNGVLRTLLRDENYLDIKIDDEEEFLSVKYGISKDIIILLKKQYKDYIRIFENLNKKPNIYIRVNTLKGTAKDLLDRLSLEYECEIVSDYSIKVSRLNNIQSNELFKNGYFTVQDLSSTEAVLSLEPKENEYILDICSAPGGKTTFIAELMANKGNVLAFDIAKNKIKLIEDTARRLGITIIDCEEKDSSVFDIDLREKFDRVLADVPCSGIGIIRRKPEIRYKNYENIKSLYNVQRSILFNASEYVKKGGILVYSTCSINKEENEKQIQGFLKKKKFELIEERTFLFNEGESDGFYIAKLRKME